MDPQARRAFLERFEPEGRGIGFAVTLFATIAVAAVFVLRSREPNAERPFKAWGYPYTPALFVIVGTATVLNGIYSAPITTLAGVAVIVIIALRVMGVLK